MERTKATFGDFSEAIGNEKIYFKDRTFDEGLNLNWGRFQTLEVPVVFSNCHFASLHIQSCHFQNVVTFHQCTFDIGPAITASVFLGKFSFIGCSAKRISIWNNEFGAGCDIMRYQCTEEATFQFGNSKGRIYIEQERTNEKFPVNKTDIQFERVDEGSISIQEINSKEIHINFAGKIKVSGISFSHLRAQNANIYHLRNSQGSILNFYDITIDHLNFHGLHNDGLMSISNVQSYNQSSDDTLFRIQEGYLGNCELYHVNLASFKKNMILNCHLQNIVPVNVKWNFNIKAYEGINHEYLRELFRQLKMVCSKNMDKIGFLRFERLEMYVYNKQINWKKNFGDWFIFKSNLYSNDYGQNWILPVVWLFGTSFIFYTMVNCIGGFDCYHVGNFFNFVMPFHAYKDILCEGDPDLNNAWIKLWDVIQRIASSYFIFQFLRAFRKFVN